MLERKRKLDCANGREKADLVLKNGNVLNVFTEEVLKADVAICGDTIVGVGEYEGKEEIDCTGKYLVPGFIDALVASSQSKIFGSEASALAIATLCLCPPESCAGYAFSFSERPTVFNSSLALSLASFFFFP